MTKTELQEHFDNTETEYGWNAGDIQIATDSLFKEIAKLEQQVAYWKLSFKKQCEATKEIICQ